MRGGGTDPFHLLILVRLHPPPPLPFDSAFYLRVQRSPEGSPRTLQINPQQAFPVEGNDYYAWFYEGSQFWTMVGGVGMVRFPLPFSYLATLPLGLSLSLSLARAR